jgi:hypothetical protein
MSKLNSLWITLLFLFSLSLFPFISDDSYAAEFSLKNDKQIRGHAPEYGIDFSGRLLKDGSVVIKLKLDKKMLIVKVRDGAEKEVRIKGYYARTGRIAAPSKEDSEILRDFLISILEDNPGSNKLIDVFLQTLNLLYSWPAEEAVWTSACQIPPPTGLSENICSEMNNPHFADYISLGDPLGIYYFGPYELYYPLDCTEPDPLYIVGPYPFEPDGCVGRCGRGCIGDGFPNNGLNRFTQNCFNHDICGREIALGLAHPYCMQMFLYTVNDFFFAEDCNPVIF